jgi:hypothetical protein
MSTSLPPLSAIVTGMRTGHSETSSALGGYEIVVRGPDAGVVDDLTWLLRSSDKMLLMLLQADTLLRSVRSEDADPSEPQIGEFLDRLFEFRQSAGLDRISVERGISVKDIDDLRAAGAPTTSNSPAS